jgi:hypothetical protein
MDQNRKFAEMAGLCLHKPIEEECSTWFSCSGCSYKTDDRDGILRHCFMNLPHFSDPREVLKVLRMQPVKEYAAFLNSGVGCYEYAEPAAGILNACEMIEADYITTPGKLRNAWIEWKENKQTKEGL